MLSRNDRFRRMTVAYQLLYSDPILVTHTLASVGNGLFLGIIITEQARAIGIATDCIPASPGEDLEAAILCATAHQHNTVRQSYIFHFCTKVCVSGDISCRALVAI